MATQLNSTGNTMQRWSLMLLYDWHRHLRELKEKNRYRYISTHLTLNRWWSHQQCKFNAIIRVFYLNKFEKKQYTIKSSTTKQYKMASVYFELKKNKIRFKEKHFNKSIFRIKWINMMKMPWLTYICGDELWSSSTIPDCVWIMK